MNRGRGFTIVELIVVMVAMGVLLALGVARLSGSQADARDNQKAAAVETIAKGLESRYIRGNEYADSTSTHIKKGSYPSINEILHAQGVSVSGITLKINGVMPSLDNILPGTTNDIFFPPNSTSTALKDNFKVICSSTSACGTTDAGNPTMINTAFNGSNAVYVYEPVAANKKPCLNAECVRYNLYYRTENGTMITITSKHQ